VTKKSRNVKKVKIAYIDRVVEPSSESYHEYYTQAARFAGVLLNTDTTTFDDLVATENLAKRNEEKVSPSKQNISGLENSRGLIKWMRNANVGEVSEAFEFGNNYVVATLTKINLKGDIPLEDVKEEIRAKVLKQKKGKMISDEINSITYKTLSELVTAMSSQSVYKPLVELATNVSFLNNKSGKLLMDWKLIGLVCASENDVITKPIIGNNAVFVAKVISRNEPRTSGDFSQQQIQISQALKQSASVAAYNAVKENAGVVDNRNDFY
jgi:peptidyl-prolyl cis-trans isomerase D